MGTVIYFVLRRPKSWLRTSSAVSSQQEERNIGDRKRTLGLSVVIMGVYSVIGNENQFAEYFVLRAVDIF